MRESKWGIDRQRPFLTHRVKWKRCEVAIKDKRGSNFPRPWHVPRTQPQVFEARAFSFPHEHPREACPVDPLSAARTVGAGHWTY